MSKCKSPIPLKRYSPESNKPQGAFVKLSPVFSFIVANFRPEPLGSVCTGMMMFTFHYGLWTCDVEHGDQLGEVIAGQCCFGRKQAMAFTH